MKLKNKIYLLQLFIVISFVLFFYIIYNNNIHQQQKNLERNIQTITQTNKHFIEKSLKSMYRDYNSFQKEFHTIHQYTQNQYLKNPNINLQTLKENIKKHFNLNDFDIDIFLIDKTYTITDATFEKDIGFHLGIIEDAKMYLDKTKKDGKIYVASNISIDILEYTLKVYSYSKLEDGKYFEMGFKFDNPIYEELKESVDDIYKKTNNKISLYRVIETSDKKQQYYNDLLNKPNENISKEDYLKTTKKFNIDKPSQNKYIDAIRFNQLQKEIIDDRYIVYIPLLTKEENQHLFYNNILMKIEIDISDYQNSLQQTKQHFFIFGFILFIILSVLYYFIKYNFYKPMIKISDIFESEKRIEDERLLRKKDEFGILIEKYNKLYDSLSKEIQLNSKLLYENKRFIADTVHQIRTPLTNIMMNGEMVKEYQNDDTLSEFIEQIDASINMLSNSYEDLAYVTSYDTIEYKPSKISLSDLLHKRVRFFTTISKVNSKEIVSQIEENIFITINEIEVERIIDNNISNGIKYAHTNKPITINLSKNNDIVTLSFKTYGNPIQNKEKVFEKNYRENEAKRGLGLGLNMVKGICEKYNITYDVSYEDGQNIFTYRFKIKN
ncbi:MAG: HAMP domain-containing histidine kinase [Campylobacterales bacterium]|nr:HAMP domain-containing histidine kinase [Campylobacterales bacterium]